MEYSIAHLVGDSIRPLSSTVPRSTADIFITSLTLRMFAPGDRARTTQAAILIRMASTAGPALRAGLSIRGRQWHRAVCAAAPLAAACMAAEASTGVKGAASMAAVAGT